jgi:hypothetical protein
MCRRWPFCPLHHALVGSNGRSAGFEVANHCFSSSQVRKLENSNFQVQIQSSLQQMFVYFGVQFPPPPPFVILSMFKSAQENPI